MKSIYLVWQNFQRRPESMQSFFSFEIFYVPPAKGRGVKKLAGYILQSWKTLEILSQQRPDVVWYQSPPTFVGHLIALHRFITASKYAIIADCHNAAFRAPWVNVPFTRQVLNWATVSLAHNAVIADDAMKKGIARSLTVLEDPPATSISRDTNDVSEQYVFVPCSFAPDEPVDAVLAAADLSPTLSFRITGNLDKAKRKGFLTKVPPNVEFLGFVSAEEYNRQFANAGVILGITNLPDVQLSVANEAIGAARALVLSDTPTLRAMFSDAAVFCENSPEDLSKTLHAAMVQKDALERRSARLCETRLAAWTEQAELVVKKANSKVNADA